MGVLECWSTALIWKCTPRPRGWECFFGSTLEIIHPLKISNHSGALLVLAGRPVNDVSGLYTPTLPHPDERELVPTPYWPSISKN
jgi:hypothetical protein